MSLLQAREVWIARPSKAKRLPAWRGDRKSTRLNSSHGYISYAVFCLKKKKIASLANASGYICPLLSRDAKEFDGALQAWQIDGSSLVTARDVSVFRLWLPVSVAHVSE